MNERLKVFLLNPRENFCSPPIKQSDWEKNVVVTLIESFGNHRRWPKTLLVPKYLWDVLFKFGHQIGFLSEESFHPISFFFFSPKLIHSGPQANTRRRWWFLLEILIDHFTLQLIYISRFLLCNLVARMWLFLCAVSSAFFLYLTLNCIHQFSLICFIFLVLSNSLPRQSKRRQHRH